MTNHEELIEVLARRREALTWEKYDKGQTYVVNVLLRSKKEAEKDLQALSEAGFQVVPVEPTQEMANRAVDETSLHYTAPQETGWRRSPQMLFMTAYKAMLQADKEEKEDG